MTTPIVHESTADLLRTPLPVFVNAEAGSAGDDAGREIREALERVGVTANVQVADPEHLVAGIREAVRAGAPAVGAAGGDGTLSSAVSAVLGSKTVLVPFPMGTLNHFARRLGVDTIEATAQCLRDGCVRALPVGTVNGRAFVNNASCGFYPHVVRHREQIRPFISKWPAAAVASLIVLLKRPRMNIALEVNGFRITRTTTAVWVGLGRDSIKLPEDDTEPVPARMLEIVIPKDHGRLALVALAIRVLKLLRNGGSISEATGIETLHAREFTLDSVRPLDIARDGEANVLDPPLQFALQPASLRVISPRP